VNDWRKSSYSGGEGNTCVETASGAGVILVRDTTDRDGGTLAFTAAAWRHFLSQVR
jgi:Domain of unknown function (DUF397)